MYNYTICFIKQENKLLMLNRNFEPVKGLWNGVGGKFGEGESAMECVLREVFEETGIRLSEARYKGIVTWNVDHRHFGGMYVFVAELPMDFIYPTPRKSEEGILDWKDVSWVLGGRNPGVGEMIPKFLPFVLNDEKCYEHQFIFLANQLIDYRTILISSDPGLSTILFTQG